MYKSANEVLRSYPYGVVCNYDSEALYEQGYVEALVIKSGDGWDVWNMHPLRKSWQHVYSLTECSPEEQVIQSIQSLKRLFVKE